MLTIAKLKRWSINYYIDTAHAAERATKDRARAGGGLGEYYSEHETRTPVWLLAGDTQTTARLVGLTDHQRAGGEADAEVVARWLEDGIGPNGAHGRTFGVRGVHGFDLTFCAPKSVSLVRALKTDDVIAKAIADAHTTALAEAMQYLSAHAGYTRVHNPVTGEKDLVRLPGLVAIAYQHETSRCGDPHLHTHVIVPNRQARADGQLVAIDGTSLYHEARAAGVIYQATLRREMHRSLAFEWEPVDPATGMAELAGVDRDSITAWSRRSTALREWAAGNLTLVDGRLSAAQLSAAQKATRPAKPEELSWGQLQQEWAADARGLHLDRASFDAARAARRAAARAPFDRPRLAEAAARIQKAAFTRADLVEIVGAQLPVDTAQSPRAVVEAAVDEVAVRLSAPRAAHQREGHERFTLDRILAEEVAVLDLVDAQEPRSMLWIKDDDTAGLSPEQKSVVENIGASPWLVQPLSAPAGAGKTTTMRALVSAAHRRTRGHVLVLAPTGKAVDVALREGAGDTGHTVAKALQLLRDNQLELTPWTLVVVDEAAMVGTDDLRQLLNATTAAGAKTVLVGDEHQLAPVKARGGMFAQLCTDLPWTQKLSEVWRMRDTEEREASLALRDGNSADVARAVHWYRTNDRLRCGDAVTMAHDALKVYEADHTKGHDALLICDTKEMARAVNQRLHEQRIGRDGPTLTAANGERVGVGDLIISRRNDPSIRLRDSPRATKPAASVRNGNRWRVAAIDTENYRLAAVRLDDGAAAVFSGDYLREHINLGYAVTVHSAQGVTADTSHAILGEATTRELLYVAMTRGRDSNTAHLYERIADTQERRGHLPLARGDSAEAAQLVRSLIARDSLPRTAHEVASQADPAEIPSLVVRFVDRRADAYESRRGSFRAWQEAVDERTRGWSTARERGVILSRDTGCSLDV
ncbi:MULTISPECIES: MobF family relaxase [Mycolicibacterium]|uniref:MobF family relaxase n=1 Tax=Mycolicibacterium TaxID=1866885 RepID=UPI001CA38589|nr:MULTISPECIES: MobF family relaxase [Mycolicibacterium]MDW5615128.1 MobF family relaxase [Mycolicibacterium sp. D5.8-2]QZT63776.1 relaxase domain-containing protein [Mycolicibacterium austroafricanum]